MYFIRFLQVTFIYKYPLTIQVDISRDCIIDTQGHYLCIIVITFLQGHLQGFKMIEILFVFFACTMLITVMVKMSIQPNSQNSPTYFHFFF